MNRYQTFFLFILLCLGLAACGRSAPPAVTSTPSAVNHTPILAQTNTLQAGVSLTPSSAPTATRQATPTIPPTRTFTRTPNPTPTRTLTPIPAYVKLRGEVIVDQAVCHYGPGAPYLYKYGVYKGSNLEIIGRVEQGTYIQVQAIGGNNPCWVNPKWMKIKGDIQNLRPIHPDDAGMPWSPYYGPLTGASARRDGSTVTVFWNPLVLRAGDDSEQVPYLIEAWVCKNGEIQFTPTGSYQTAVKIIDEPGCSTPSHGRLYAAEKHGYTRWVKIPWPTAEPAQQ